MKCTNCFFLAFWGLKMVEEYVEELKIYNRPTWQCLIGLPLVFQCTKLVGGRHSQPPRQSIHWTWRHVPMKVLSLTFAC